MRTRAVVVTSAAYSRALNLWISFKALSTCTNRFVVFHATIGVSTARAGVLADVIDTRFVVRTLTVRDTSGYDACYRLACTTSAADVSWWTHANHCSNWYGWYHLALCGVVAGLENNTGVLAFCV